MALCEICNAYSMFGVLGNVVENELVRVTGLIKVFLVGVWHYTADNLGDCVIELGVTTEFLPLLGVLVLICHALLR